MPKINKYYYDKTNEIINSLTKCDGENLAKIFDEVQNEHGKKKSYKEFIENIFDIKDENVIEVMSNIGDDLAENISAEKKLLLKLKIINLLLKYVQEEELKARWMEFFVNFNIEVFDQRINQLAKKNIIIFAINIVEDEDGNIDCESKREHKKQITNELSLFFKNIGKIKDRTAAEILLCNLVNNKINVFTPLIKKMTEKNNYNYDYDDKKISDENELEFNSKIGNIFARFRDMNNIVKQYIQNPPSAIISEPQNNQQQKNTKKQK